MAQFFLELLSEEIPARMQAGASIDLERLVVNALADAGLTWESSRRFVTPRRLVLVLEGLPTATPDIAEERRGPRLGSPQAALDGFLKSVGLTIDQCETRQLDKGAFYFAMVRKSGMPTAEVLKRVIEQVLAEFPWPKSMRWGDSSVRWVRPLQSIICLFDGKVVPVSFGNVVAGNSTSGHRFMVPSSFAVSSFGDYATGLAAARVILDPVERRAKILAQAETLAKAEGLTLRQDDHLFDEVTGLVEWPVLLAGTIDQDFMEIPDEVLITSMRSHQKYLSLLKKDGCLSNRFLVVANMATSDNGQGIVAGNERVLRARLSDARFFWQADRKQSLEARLPRLSERVFYQGLGTLHDKIERLAILAGNIAVRTGGNVNLARRAARLSKADLSTEMVGEFPELQGIMGCYYALHDGEPTEIGNAISEHYSPQGPGDFCPSAPLSVAVSLADKIDSLVGFFGIGEKPTGSKDPFALRRAALGIIRLVLENNMRIPLRECFMEAHQLYGDRLVQSGSETARELLEFFADRLKVYLREKGYRHDLVTAVFALGHEDDLVRLLSRVESLKNFLSSDDGANLLTAYRRAANIVRIEEKKDGFDYADMNPEIGDLHLPEEKTLKSTLDQLAPQIHMALSDEQFDATMRLIAMLRRSVDQFFEKVTVNSADTEERCFRLGLLAQVRKVMNLVADFSAIEG